MEYRNDLFAPSPNRIESVSTPATSTPYIANPYGTSLATTIFGTSTPNIAKDSMTYGTPLSTTTSSYVFGESETMTLVKDCACEFLGTLLLFFVVVLCSCASYFYIAFFYVALIYTFWFTSGAHFNPAISLAMLFARRMKVGRFIAYIISQFMGGAIGGILFHFIFHGYLTVTVTPVSPYTLADANVIQFIYTTMLTFVALNISCTGPSGMNMYFGIGIGFVILAGGAVACAISTGALFNPALCVGLMVAAFDVGSCFWYILVEVVSAVVGAILYIFYRDHAVEHDPGDFFGTSWFGEFLGTFWFVVSFSINVGLGTGYSALSGGGALVSMIYALGFSSGCFNPAVTFATMVSGFNTFSRRHGFGHMVVQCVAAILAAFVAYAICSNHYSYQLGVPEAVPDRLASGLFISSKSDTYGWGPVVIFEFFFSLVLVYVVLVTTSESQQLLHDYYALVIGFAFFGASEAAYSISGGYLNPALALGIAIDARGTTGWYVLKLLWYWIPEFLGAWVAGSLVRWLYKGEVVGARKTPMNTFEGNYLPHPVTAEKTPIYHSPATIPAGPISTRLPSTTGSVAAPPIAYHA